MNFNIYELVSDLKIKGSNMMTLIEYLKKYNYKGVNVNKEEGIQEDRYKSDFTNLYNYCVANRKEIICLFEKYELSVNGNVNLDNENKKITRLFTLIRLHSDLPKYNISYDKKEKYIASSMINSTFKFDEGKVEINITPEMKKEFKMYIEENNMPLSHDMVSSIAKRRAQALYIDNLIRTNECSKKLNDTEIYCITENMLFNGISFDQEIIKTYIDLYIENKVSRKR